MQTRASRVDLLATLIRNARALLAEAARVSDWESLLAREEKLRHELSAVLADPIQSEEVAAVRIALQELLALNQQTVAIIENRMNEASSALQHVSLVQRAAQAYGHTANCSP
ncbi:flagellar protein FliT [Acidihalobacter ferrooxydans]|uniref:Flagellar protein FliT n=1 Tax=Acidihalobacter ferrooxydans TaxID=1765967 RepID=A0A1P8UGK9_9GAMM|nr:flagellar protein FliT [Acidihalobacter ferrooxydans]APZ42998.1 hypothetical protein BW247_07750 [Acidihalobacter ferrooxydans]